MGPGSPTVKRQCFSRRARKSLMILPGPCSDQVARDCWRCGRPTASDTRLCLRCTVEQLR